MTTKLIIGMVAAALMATPAYAVTNAEWDSASNVKCANAPWLSPVWDAVGDVDDPIINSVCKTRLVYMECKANPRMTVGQALASIHYKIEFGRPLPQFRCGA